MAIAGKTEKWLSEELHKGRFICISIRRFIPYFSFNFSCFEHNESLPVTSWFWNFMSLFGCFHFWVLTHFPEVICPRYDLGMACNITCHYCDYRLWHSVDTCKLFYSQLYLTVISFLQNFPQIKRR